MSLAFARAASVDRAVGVLRAGVVARDLCRRDGRGAVAAVFERSFYLRVGEDFICIGAPEIRNGPTTLIVAARVAGLGLRQGQPAFITSECIRVGDLLFDLSACQTWRAPPWSKLPSPAALRDTCASLAHRAAAQSPADSLMHAVFSTTDTPLARLARPRVAAFEAWLSERILALGWAKRRRRVPTINDRGGHGASRLSAPYGLIGLGPGLTPSGDDFLIGALAALDALRQANIHASLGRAVIAAAGGTTPLSASLLRAAAAGHIGESLHMMIAALVTGDADAAIAAAVGIGHTSGWDALTGAAVTVRSL
jgi:hypothetical protein